MGLARCMSIKNHIVSRRSLTREQVQLVVFGDTGYARWKCRSVLKRLCDTGKLKRGRCMVSNDYVYFSGRPPDKIDHLIQVNWVWVALVLTGKLDYFENEPDCGVVIPDAYFILDGKPYFLELHRAVNQRKFDKIQKYAEYYRSGAWNKDDWPMPGKFARIVVVVEVGMDVEKIRKVVKVDNKEGLWVNVVTLEQVRKDVWKCLR